MSQTPDFVDIYVDLLTVAAWPDEPDVGKIYEVAINGVGYMLADDPENPERKWRRGKVPLFPERLATTETPFSQAVNRYTFAAASEFEGGEGQDFANRSDADPKKFKDGERVDPFGSAGLTLGPGLVLERIGPGTKPLLAVVGNALYAVQGTDKLEHSTAPGTWVTLSGISDTTGAVTISDFTSDGVQWYAATSRSVIRGTTTDPGADWSSLDAVSVQWAAGRIMAAVKGATSSTANILTSINSAGAEEKTGGLISFPDSHTVMLGGTSAGFYYFVEYAGVHGSVYAWKLGLDSSGGFFTPTEAWTLPAGSTLVDISAVAGSVFVQVSEADTNDLVLYRGIPTETGQLTVTKVATLDGAGVVPQSAVIEWAGKALLLWPDNGPGPGVAAVDLKSGGFARWSDGVVTSSLVDIDVWQGKVVISDTSGKLSLMDLATPSSSGWVTTPIVDGASALDKVWDDVTVMFEPLSTGESVQVEFTVDGGGSYTRIGTAATAGSTRFIFAIGVQAPSMGLRITLSGSAGSAPTMQAAMLRLHPLGLVDGVLVLPVQCSDRVRGLNGKVLPAAPGSGSTRARTLEALAGSRVRLQDIDWPYTATAEIYEVLQAETSAVWLQNKNTPNLQMVTTLTMRKTVSGYTGGT